MKLILSSAGFTTETIVQKTEELVGKSRKDISIAVINEAYAVEQNNLRWVLEDLNLIEKNFGGKLELVNLLALDLETVQERIQSHDVIFVEGGHTDYLMSVFTRTGFATLLPELLETKVYVGSSAGGMVMGKRLSDESYLKMYQEENKYGINHYMGFVDVTIMPHLYSEYFPNRKESLEQAVVHHSGTVYGIKDDTALIVEDGNITTIGSEPIIISNS